MLIPSPSLFFRIFIFHHPLVDNIHVQNVIFPSLSIGPFSCLSYSLAFLLVYAILCLVLFSPFA
jgi:hypothetical protein